MVEVDCPYSLLEMTALRATGVERMAGVWRDLSKNTG